jgi:hypothetical protein
MEKTSSPFNFSLPFRKANSTTKAASMIDKNSLLGGLNVSKQKLFVKSKKTIDDYLQIKHVSLKCPLGDFRK